MKDCWLARCSVEKWSRSKRSYYWGSGWKVVDAKGEDLILPYAQTKTEARESAQAMGWTIKGVFKHV